VVNWGRTGESIATPHARMQPIMCLLDECN
jgi:hypothetical protein